MGRSCARPACGGPAITTLSYDYANAVVWIEALHDEGHPMHHDLCERHAARLSVPRGWTLVDEREARPSADGDDASVADAWDPSGTVEADRGDVHAAFGRLDEPASGRREVGEAQVLEPTLFGDWPADDDRHSLAS